MKLKERHKERIVVAGAGLAGLRAAERLREVGFGGELVMIGAERYRPYHRPALTKQMLSGELRPRDLALESYVDLDAIWRFGKPALRLDPHRHIVELEGEEEIRYDGLVLATGVESRHLPGAPRHDRRVHVLRTLRDAVAVQRNLRRGDGRVAVIGGGFTACEIASTAREMGREVTLISRGRILCDRVFGKELGARITELHHEHGVQLALGAQVTHWMPQSWGIGMYLSTGQLVVADCVILAVGGVPSVQWLRGSGLTIEDGVLCRPTCHVQGANDIVAAGDVARWPNLRFEAVPRRLEHWINAVEMGRHAAESLLAGPGTAKPFTPLPRFWTEQHGIRIQAAGMPSLGQDAVRLSGKPGRKGVIGRLRGGRLIGIVGWDSPRGMLRWTAELERELRRPWTSSMPAIPAEPTVVEAVPEDPPALPAVATSLPGNESLESMATREAIAAMERQMAYLEPMEFLRPNEPTRPAVQSRAAMPPVNRPAAQSVPGMEPVARPAVQSMPGMEAVPPPLAARSQPGMQPVAPPPIQSRSGMRPVPPPAARSRQGMPPVPPPAARSRQDMPPVPPPAARSRQDMRPAPPPMGPSRSGMRPVPPPAQSRQHMPPVPPPDMEHTSPGRQPVIGPRADMPPPLRSRSGMRPALPRRTRSRADGPLIPPPPGQQGREEDLPHMLPPSVRSMPVLPPMPSLAQMTADARPPEAFRTMPKWPIGRG